MAVSAEGRLGNARGQALARRNPTARHFHGQWQVENDSQERLLKQYNVQLRSDQNGSVSSAPTQPDGRTGPQPAPCQEATRGLPCPPDAASSFLFAFLNPPPPHLCPPHPHLRPPWPARYGLDHGRTMRPACSQPRPPGDLQIFGWEGPKNLHFAITPQQLHASTRPKGKNMIIGNKGSPLNNNYSHFN